MRTGNSRDVRASAESVPKITPRSCDTTEIDRVSHRPPMIWPSGARIERQKMSQSNW